MLSLKPCWKKNPELHQVLTPLGPLYQVSSLMKRIQEWVHFVQKALVQKWQEDWAGLY